MSLRTSSHITNELPLLWDAFIDSHPEGSVLQSWFMYTIFKDTLHFDPIFVYCTDAGNFAGVLSGVLITESYGLKGLFSSRLILYGGPLVAVNHKYRKTICELLLRELNVITSKKAIFTQFRATSDMTEFKDCFLKFGFTWHPRLNLLIDTTSREEALRGLSPSRRRQINKSVMNGASVIEPESVTHVFEFYSILKKLYRLKVKKPLPDFSFFESFYQKTRAEGHGKIFLVQYEGKIIGGILCPLMKNKSMFEWYVCGLDKMFVEKNIYPSVLATWAAIEYATLNNIRQFDFMGLGKPDVKYGVRDFKLRFGGEVVNYGRFIRVNRPVFYWIAELGFNFLSLIKKL